VLLDGDVIFVQKNCTLGTQASSTQPPPKRMLKRSATGPIKPQNSSKVLCSSKERKSVPIESQSSLSSVHTLDSPPSRRSVANRSQSLNWGSNQEEWGLHLVETFTKSSGDLKNQRKLLKKRFEMP